MTDLDETKSPPNPTGPVVQQRAATRSALFSGPAEQPKTTGHETPLNQPSGPVLSSRWTGPAQSMPNRTTGDWGGVRGRG